MSEDIKDDIDIDEKKDDQTPSEKKEGGDQEEELKKGRLSKF